LARVTKDLESIQVLSSSVNEEEEDISVNVNAQSICQYIYSVLLRPLGGVDNLVEQQNVLQMTRTIFTNFDGLPDEYGNVGLPRAIIRLRKALEPRKIGRYTFTTNWDNLNLVQNDIGTNGFLVSNCGFNAPYPTGSFDTSGFNVTTPVTPYLNEYQMSQILSQYSGRYDLIPYNDFVDDRTDASAFAYSIQDPIPSTSQWGSFIAYIVGFDNSGNPLYVKQSGVAACETKIKRPDLAALRLGTQTIKCVSSVSPSSTTNSTRCPNYICKVTTTPSLSGYNSGTKRIRGIVQLKPTPVTLAVQNILDRLEAIVVHGDTSAANVLYNKWIATFSSNDVLVLCFNWFRAFHMQYTGAHPGTVLYQSNSNSSAVLNCNNLEYHAGSDVFTMCKVPQPIMESLGTHAPYMDKLGTILPWWVSFAGAGLTHNVIASGTYTGSSTITTIPAAEYNSGSFNGGLAVVTKYKSLEDLLAMYVNLNVFAKSGQSLLDCSLLVDGQSTAFGNVLGLHTRRPLSTYILDAVRSTAGWTTYDVQNVPTSTLNFNEGVNINNKEYRQYYRRDFSGFDTLGGLQKSTWYDGVVNSGQTSNISDNTGTNHPAGDPIFSPPRELSADTQFISKLNRLVPRHGQYCGPGWTAGIDSADGDPPLVNGKYSVEPVDVEDSICKRHDEAYALSGNDPTKLGEADREMVSSLEKLRSAGQLSLYGNAALVAIRAKSHLRHGDRGPNLSTTKNQ
jgi:hypothetical protein